MLTTVTTTTQDLTTILGADNVVVAQKSINARGPFKVLIQNLGTPDIYVDFITAATLTGGVKIAQNASFSFEDVELADCNLISDTSSNTDVRIVIN